MKRRKSNSRVQTSILLPAIEYILISLTQLSIYHWIYILNKILRRWPDDERIPFWFAEVYVLSWLLILSLAFWFVSKSSCFWVICLILASYRMFELGQSLASIFVLELQRRRDEQGRYLLVRNSIRWILLTVLNFTEIIICFSFAYLTWGESFNPPIVTHINAVYQSIVTFVALGGYLPNSDPARIIIIVQLGYFILFLIMIAPIILSVIRAKERTNEVLGRGVRRDKRIL